MRIAALSSHPIQYQAPLFRRLAAQPGIEFEALFCHDHGVKPSPDPGFGVTFKYDVPLLDGYKSKFLSNWSPKPSLKPTGQLNPSILEYVRRDRLDAILVHGYAAATNLIALLGHSRHVKVVLRGDSNLHDPRPLWKRGMKQVFLRGLFSRVDQFAAVGSRNGDYYRHYGVQDERITLAPFSVDNEFFAQGPQSSDTARAQTRRELGIGPEVPVFIFCGKLIPNKRPLDVVRAFASARRVGSAALLVVGDGGLARVVRQEIDRLNLQSEVKMLGFKNQSELPKLYAASDVLVIPSDREAWGLVVNEAMASGTTVLASDRVGAAPDLVQASNVFPVGRVDVLATQMERWVRYRELLAESKAESTKRIQQWGIAQTTAGIISAVETALSR